jgi:molybdopterin molybdotransferase
MISIESAQRIILSRTCMLPVEEVPLLQGLGRISAKDVYAAWDIPQSDNSAMDGYAVSSPDPKRYQWVVADFIPAGSVRTTPVAPGEAVRIMTGAQVPPGCNTIVPIEDVVETKDGVRFTCELKTGSNIRKRGEDVRANDLTITAGTTLRPQEIGLLASLGETMVTVYRKARIAILATGNELLDAGAVPSPGKIINSNSYTLAAQVLEAGGEPLLIGIAPDTPASIRNKIREGLEADMLITSGGVSVGDCDFVKESILELGGELLFQKVSMKPGKPVTFAVLGGKHVFALPGNPVAAMVAFEMFVRPAMLRMMGHSRIFRPTVRAVLPEQTVNRGDRPHFIRVRTTLLHGVYTAKTTDNQSSANLVSLTQGNALLRLAPNASIAAGSMTEIIMLDREFEMGGINNAAA